MAWRRARVGGVLARPLVRGFHKLIGRTSGARDAYAARAQARMHAHRVARDAKIAERIARGNARRGVNPPECLDIAKKPVSLAFDNISRSWTTPDRLNYEQGSIHENRIKHVLDHAKPNLSKAAHSVLNVDRNQILGLVDDAWLARGSPVVGDAGAYIIPMNRIVGTAGGMSIKIIVRPGTSRIITAYPL